MVPLGKKQMTVGALIDALEAAARHMDADARVFYDFCRFYPSGMSSYRGFYEDLAIHYSSEGEGPLLSEFIASLKAKIGQDITGWKGGDYEVTRDTTTWVDECADELAAALDPRETAPGGGR